MLYFFLIKVLSSHAGTWGCLQKNSNKLSKRASQVSNVCVKIRIFRHKKTPVYEKGDAVIT